MLCTVLFQWLVQLVQQHLVRPTLRGVPRERLAKCCRVLVCALRIRRGQLVPQTVRPFGLRILGFIWGGPVLQPCHALQPLTTWEGLGVPGGSLTSLGSLALA